MLTRNPLRSTTSRRAHRTHPVVHIPSAAVTPPLRGRVAPGISERSVQVPYHAPAPPLDRHAPRDGCRNGPEGTKVHDVALSGRFTARAAVTAVMSTGATAPTARQEPHHGKSCISNQHGRSPPRGAVHAAEPGEPFPPARVEQPIRKTREASPDTSPAVCTGLPSRLTASLLELRSLNKLCGGKGNCTLALMNMYQQRLQPRASRNTARR